MQREDFRRFGMALTACAELYGKGVSEGAQLLWWEALDGFTIEQVEAAFKRAIRDPDGGQFMPKPADLIRQLRGAAADEALIAWGTVLETARREGANSSAARGFTGATRQALAAIGGYAAVCRADEEQNGFLQKRFCDGFKAYRGMEERSDEGAGLLDAPDAHSRLSGPRSI
jgi:hypothetical protein